MIKAPFIGIAGNIGVGKTTFTDIIAQKMGWKPFYESVADNPYLSDFYGDMQRWSFNLQIYFLHHRFRNQREIAAENSGVIQDRTIYEDVEIFARNLHELGNIDQRDWENYSNLFAVMTSYLRKPDLIIYLRASTDTLISRIENRDRDYEKTIDPEYLHRLNISYDRWINGLTDIPVLVVETDQFNIFTDQEKLAGIIDEMTERLTI
ncbi:MAG: deoxynucleoside kinase [Candidatus Marinimicrobia bacterium]|nr:deoxynucleoside kinase [Candidatus Neomarinimicrobiota bacterium]